MTTVTAAVPRAKKKHQSIHTAFGKELYSSFLQQCHLPAVITNQVAMLKGEMCQMFKPEPVVRLLWELTRASYNHLLGFPLPLQNLFGEGCVATCALHIERLFLTVI